MPKTRTTSNDFGGGEISLDSVDSLDFLQSLGDVSLAAWTLMPKGNASAARLDNFNNFVKMQTKVEIILN